jgi:hypothetical protein
MLARRKVVAIVAVSLAGVALSCGCLRAGEPQKSARQGPLAELPSRPGAHLEKIKALGENQWLELGTPAADPKWGKARGSAWGAKALILAPELRGAFLFGEGVHAYVKPDGHIMDDLWFYDIHAHRWICLYPGTNTLTFNQRVKDRELLIDDDGLLRDRDGQAIPVHTIIHAWGNLTYDSDRQKFAFLAGNGLGRYYLGNEKQMDEGVKLLEAQQQGKSKTVFSPWYFDVASGKFERSAAANATRVEAGGFPQLHYLPSQQRFIAVGSDTVAWFDPAKNEWTDAKPRGPMPKGYDGPGCFDSKRNRVYRNDGDGNEGKGLMAYDIQSNTWIELGPTGTPPEPMNTNGAFYNYDPALDVVVAIQMRGNTAGVFTYNPKTNSWTAPLPFPADGPKFNFAANTCYDPELNAYFCHVAGDSSDNGVVWAYRYKSRD